MLILQRLISVMRITSEGSSLAQEGLITLSKPSSLQVRFLAEQVHIL